METWWTLKTCQQFATSKTSCRAVQGATHKQRCSPKQKRTQRSLQLQIARCNGDRHVLSCFFCQPRVACKGKPANPTPTFYGSLFPAQLGAPALLFSGEASMFTQSDATRVKAKTCVLRHTVRSSRSSPLQTLVVCARQFLKTP